MIDSAHKETVEGARFSILIPTWNNLPYLRLCVESIRKNSRYPHQIIVHVNEGTDGTLAWVRNSGLSYSHSEQNVGICWALNAMRRLVETEYVLYMNDDMYVCPDWDVPLWKELSALPDERFFLSSTLLQPRKFWCSSVISPADFGDSVERFDEQALLAHYDAFQHRDWAGATWPPNLVHRDVWDLVGGYSVEFSPGMYSDPDFAAKLVLAGVRHFKGLSDSRVYHFEARSTARVRKNAGSKQFLMKWGITSSSFMTNVMRRGEPFVVLGEAVQPKLGASLLRARLKRVFLAASGTGSSRKVWEL